MSELRELLERVEKATGPNTEIEVELIQRFISAKEGDLHRRYTIAVYGFTSSIDAAIALVERVRPGWAWNVGNVGEEDRPSVALTVPFEPYQDFVAHGATPALAVIAALLRSLIAERSP